MGPAHTRNSSTEPTNGTASGWGNKPPITKLESADEESGSGEPKDAEDCHRELRNKLIDPEIESNVATKWMEEEEEKESVEVVVMQPAAVVQTEHKI